MTHQVNPLSCDIQEIDNTFCRICLLVPSSYITKLYDEVSHAQKMHIETLGFSKNNTPVSYIQEYYKNNIIEHIKEFTFKYFIINSLFEHLFDKKVRSFGEPRLSHITVEPNHDATFEFEVSLSKPIDFLEWKNFAFKAPKRKNYKDIDRQVETFIKQEQQLEKEQASDTIAVGDWISFDIGLCSENNQPLIDNHLEKVWLKIGNEEADMPFQDLFIGKKVGDAFCTRAQCLQDYFSNQLKTNYNFFIKIEEVVHNNYFSFADFKHHFRLKTNKEVQGKLIEIFSYRNDFSQRRNIVEESLKLLVTKHHVEAPNHLVLRQQKIVLESVQSNPDYQVYKTQPNFKDFIRQLATKQVKETILIDQLSFHENIKVTNPDIKGYLNLLKRPRTKEFVYFTPPPTKIEGQEMPIPAALLKRCCIREKTLNHAIYHLTRK
jgi:FKBP-type peptidyl-prolyl cis-trans isomerase (trigger factor)